MTAVVNRDGRLVSSDYRPTQAKRPVEAVIDDILDSISDATRQAGISNGDVTGIGFAIAGVSNPVTGVLHTSPHLPNWQNVPVSQMIREKTGKPTFLFNDANAAAYGELRYGAAVGTKNFIYITVSTGIGGGIVIDGELYAGATGTAGEIGHMSIDRNGPRCSCGGRGCWEMFASGTALAKRAREKISSGTSSMLLGMVHNELEKVDAVLIEAASKQGDALANELIAETSRYLAIGFGNLINLFNPELIVVGGGMSNMGDRLLKPAFSQAAHWCFPDAYAAVRFVRASLGGNAGVLGAAAWAMEQGR